MRLTLKPLLFFVLFSTGAWARDEQAIRIERDLSIMVSQLNLLMEKKTDVLLESMRTPEKNRFEQNVLNIKNQIEKLSQQFATKGRP